MTFEQWLAELDELAAHDGLPDYTHGTGADAWRDLFDSGFSPAEAWAYEKSYAAEGAE